MRVRMIGAAMAAWLISQPAAAIDLTPAMAKMYDDLSIGYPTDAYMTVCYGFNCRRRYELIFTEADRKRLTELLTAGKKSAEDERKAVQQAVLWFDRRLGPIIGTDKRVARADVRAFADRHNYDCFDTTQHQLPALDTAGVGSLEASHGKRPALSRIYPVLPAAA